MTNLKTSLYIAIGAGSVFLASCKKDFLDKQPDDMLTLDQVFASRVESEKYLANVYSHVPNPLEVYENLSFVGDEGDMVWNSDSRTSRPAISPNSQTANNINSGNWSPASTPFDRYAYFYKGIRSATVYISRIGECKECEVYEPGIVSVRRAEARVLRAFYYYNLMRQYGPVTILNDIIPVDAAFDDTQIPRNSYDECVNYIVSELDAAMASLPMKITNTSQYGRCDKRTALAIKSRVLLYAASPLWNGNTAYANFKNADGKPLVNTTYDENKWKAAADAAKAIIDVMPDGLYKKNNTSGVFDPFISYRDVFLDRWNQEVIWARPNSSGSRWEMHTIPRQVGGWNGLGPTQQLVDSYQMANGKMITETGSGYLTSGFSTANGTYTKSGEHNMYINREPRFYASVAYNGSEWINNNTAFKVQLYFTGLSGLNGSHDHSNTGYLVRKMCSPNSDRTTGKYVQQAFAFFRLAEIYLNYAEALNEYAPGNADILTYVNLVRARGGIPGLPAGLNQSEMRERIRNERRIELAFEEHRLFDTRRWKIAPVTDGGPMYGMNVNAGTSLTDASFFAKTVFENRVFQTKHYLWPIPEQEIVRNKKMVQNPGW